MLAAQVKIMCNHSHVQYPVAMNPMYWKLIVLQSINGVVIDHYVASMNLFVHNIH